MDLLKVINDMRILIKELSSTNKKLYLIGKRYPPEVKYESFEIFIKCETFDIGCGYEFVYDDKTDIIFIDENYFTYHYIYKMLEKYYNKYLRIQKIKKLKL